VVGIFGFLLGLSVGIVLLLWQRSRLLRRLRNLLQDVRLSPTASTSIYDTATQLAWALTRQQKVQADLSDRLEQYREILNCAPIGYLQVDDENRLVWCNAQVRSLLGIPPASDPMPRLLLELVRSYELDELVEQTRETQQFCQRDWIFYPVSPDPSQISRQMGQTLRGKGYPLMNDQVAIFLENRAEAELLKQQRDRWASDVAHELKTPLTSIRLVAETLQSRVDPVLQGWVNRLLNETIRLSSLVQDLLDLAQLDRTLPESLATDPVQLPELIQAAWLNLEPLVRKKQIQFDYQGPTQLVAYADQARLYRVLINLLDNSIKFSPPWGCVQVLLYREPPTEEVSGGVVVLEVIDDGPGFPEEDLPFVFERFYKADPSRSRQPSQHLPSLRSDRDGDPEADPELYELQRRSSTGLGLAIVRQIIEAHRGQVSAQNHPRTGGAWLTVRLPQI